MDKIISTAKQFILSPKSEWEVVKSDNDTAHQHVMKYVLPLALISAVAISDLMRNTKDIVARDFRVEAYFVSAVIYLLLTYVLVFIFKKIEKKKAYYR